MKSIICGAGDVGYSIADKLSKENFEVIVIDESKERLKKISDNLDVKTVLGAPSLPSTLSNASAKECDILIAVTKSDETNMVICQVAHSIFKITKKIARIRTQEFLSAKFNKLFGESNLPIDVIISPEMEVARSLQRRLEAPGALDNVPFAANKIKVLEININKSCPLVNTELAELTKKFPSLNANILGVIREGKFVILKKKDKLKINDKAFVVISASQIDITLSAFGHEEKMSKKILIIGGGNIGFNLAKNLENDHEGIRVKIIEKNKDRAEFIANELNNTIVINGDGLDDDVLKEANVEEAETVLSLTNDDEDNIMASVLAEKFNPHKRTIALVNKQNYSLLQSSLKIDDLIDPRMTTISTILKHVHKGTIETVYSLLDGEYEFIEAEIIETSELINKELKNSNLPDEIRIGAILRDNKIIIPRSNFVFKKKDTVVFLSKRDQMPLVENMFRISSI